MRHRVKTTIAAQALILIATSIHCCVLVAADEPVSGECQPRFRGPAGLLLVDEGKLLLTANHRSGSISVIDAEAGRVIDEIPVGKKLSDLAAVPGRDLLLATDAAAHEVILVTRTGRNLSVAARMPVAAYPVSIIVNRDGNRGWVASLWSRRLTVVELGPSRGEGNQHRLRISKVLPLPFAPRQQILVSTPQERLIIADAFGGRLAVVDAATGDIVQCRDLPAHNIRGLALNADGNRLLVSHQILNSLARTTPDDVHWGMLMGNVIRSLKLDNVLDRETDVLRECVVHPVGDAGNAAADPADIALAAKGQIAVALAGVGEVGLISEDQTNMRRVAVAGRPRALAMASDGNQLYVADELRDAISVVNVSLASKTNEISLGPQPELSVADHGERLFYDGRLSHDGWMSCHSCHADGHSNGLLNDNLGDGFFGAPKRVLSLMGAGRTGPWAWNGQMHDLEAQIRKSVETTMRGPSPRSEQVEALAAFLRTLPPAPSVDCAADINSESIARGRALFEARQCTRCHVPPEYTSAATYDVGLKDEFDGSKFNPPSLRGVGQRDRLFHDNRAKSLDDVLTRFKHQLDAQLSDCDLPDLVAFLRSL
jgi:YVTN family beta-propeller protein